MSSKVHRVRYYNPKPQLINCISLNKTNKHIALARGDASIEIWDINYAPYLLKFIPGVKDGSVEALGWVDDRLLSTGLGGALVEWDLQKLCVKTTVLLTGYAAWCLDVSPTNTVAAVGTEQGYVNLYNVESNEIVYLKLFDKQEGRILSCKFNATGTILATGSIDTIRVWQVQTGQAISRMLVSRRGQEAAVWCLYVLADNTIISGDSHGRLTFWDGNIGEQIESYSTHKADILSITVSDDEKRLYCSGRDPVIANFIKVSDDKHSKARWVKNVLRHIHEHDVRALALCGERLVSVGVDGYLTLSSYPPKRVMRIPYTIPAPRSSICAQKTLLLLRYSNYLEIWKLGTCATENGNIVLNECNQTNNTKKTHNNNLESDSRIDIMQKASLVLGKECKTLKLSESPMKLVSVQSKGGKQLRCCVLSPSGEFIIYSTDSHIRMLKLEIDDDQTNISLSKMTVNGISGCCDRVAFTEDSRTMVIHSGDFLGVFQVDPLAGASLIQNINIVKHLKTTSILHLYLSKNTSSGIVNLVVSDTFGAIAVWNRDKKQGVPTYKFEHHVTLPTYKCVVSALTVDGSNDTLIATYVDQKVIEYDLGKRTFKDWINSALPPDWFARTSAVTSITVHPARDALVFKDETSLWILERKLIEKEEPSVTKKSKGVKTGKAALKVVPIKYLADFHWIDTDEAVIVEILPENIVSQLPAMTA